MTETRTIIDRHIELALTGCESQLELAQRETGIKDALAQKCIDRAIKHRALLVLQNPSMSESDLDASMYAWFVKQREYMNPFINLPCMFGLTHFVCTHTEPEVSTGLDPHRDTPVEPLHTVLLGVIKYLWGKTCADLLTRKHLDLFQCRLSAINTRSLNIPPIRASYLVQYRGSLIGRQFKQLVQVISFIIHGLVSDNIWEAWQAAGKMTATLWYPEIDDMNAYCVRLPHSCKICPS